MRSYNHVIVIGFMSHRIDANVIRANDTTTGKLNHHFLYLLIILLPV